MFVSALIVIALLGVPIALLVKRKSVARLQYKARFFTIVGVAWVLVLAVLGSFQAKPTQPTASAPSTGPTPTAPAPEPAQPATAPAPTTPAVERVMVGRVIDGDTLELSDGRTVRVLGINTPERGEACFTEATDNLKSLIGSAPVELAPDTTQADTDKYGRILRYVTETYFLNGDLSTQQASAGFARYYDVGTAVQKAGDINEAVSAAQNGQVGLWSAAGPCQVAAAAPAAPPVASSAPDVPYVPAPNPPAPNKPRTGHSGHPCMPGERDGDHDGFCGEGR